MFCSNLFTATKSKIFLLIAVSIILIIRLVSDAWSHSEDWHDHGVDFGEGHHHDVNGFADSDHSYEKFGITDLTEKQKKDYEKYPWTDPRLTPPPRTLPHSHRAGQPLITHELYEDPPGHGSLDDGKHRLKDLWGYWDTILDNPRLYPADHGFYFDAWTEDGEWYQGYGYAKSYVSHSHKLKPGHYHDPPPPQPKPPNKPPTFDSQAISDISATVGIAITKITLPEATDSDGENSKIVYAVQGLPSEFGFNSETRELVGTPVAVGTSTCTYTATDARSGVATLTFSITINAAPKPPIAPKPPPEPPNKSPTFGTQTISSVSATVGIAIGQVTLPAATDPDGENSKIVYAVQGLPSGFGFNSDTRVLVGTPTAVGTSTCTYTATDEKGAIATLSFELYISEPVEPPEPPAPPEPIEPPDPPAPPEPIEPVNPPVEPPTEPHQGSVINTWTQTVSRKQIGFSELMFASEGGVNSDPHPQWIELYNNSSSDTVNLSGFTLTIEARDKNGKHRYMQTSLNYLEIEPNSAVIIVAMHSDKTNISRDNMYEFYNYHPNYGENSFLGLSGFYLKLEDHNGMIVDEVGNINGKQGEDSPTWQLPEDILSTRRRTSLVRRYNVVSDTPEDGKLKKNWKPTSLFTEKADMHYGIRTDVSTPAYRNKDKALPVELSHFGAKSVDGNVVVTWATQSELNNAGFNILRSENPNADFRIINPALIAGQGTTSDKTEYSYKDTAANRNTQYYYRIQEVSIDGEIQVVDQVNMKGYISPSNKLVSKWATIKQR